MSLIRLSLKTPIHWDLIRIVQVNNPKLTQDLVDYRFQVDWESLGLGNIRQVHELGIPLRTLSTLSTVLRIVGAYATLWIGPYKGIIAPMDVQPSGWIYANGQEVEPEIFWQWTPDKYSQQAILQDANKVFNEGMKTLLEKSEGVFQKLFSYQIHRSYGEILKVDAIALQDLARIVKLDTDWIFEFQKDD
jgi:hypothetical protein